MKHFFAFLTLLTLSLPCLAQWQPTNGPATNTASFFDGGKYVFATTSDGLYRSGDFGATWEIVEALPRHYFYESVTKSPDSSQIVTIAYDGVCQCVCLFRSIDDGETWEKISTPGFADYISSLHVGDRGYLLASVRRYKSGTEREYSVWESKDGGETWQKSPLDALYGPFKSGFRQFGDKIWGRTGTCLFKGNLDGTQWAEVSKFPDSISIDDYFIYDKIVLAFHFRPSATYIYRSVDGGLSWQPIKLAQAFPFYSGVTSKIQRHANILLSMGSFDGFHAGVVRSDDGGLNWEQHPLDTFVYQGGFLLKWPYVLTYKPREGVLRSSDLGRHFEPMNERLGSASLPNALARLGDWLYISNTESSHSKEGIVKYNLSSGIWHVSPQPPYADRFHFSNQDLFTFDSRIFHTNSPPGLIYRSDDGGLSWKDCALFDSNQKRILSANHFFAVKNSLFIFFDNRISSNNHDFYRTNDYGTTWQDLITPQACVGWGVSMAGNVGDVVFAAKSYSSCLYRSEDLGDTWSEVPVPDIPVNTDTGLVYILGMEPTGKRILLTMRRWERQQEDFFYFVSNDLGNTWQPCEMPLPHTRKFSFGTRMSTLEVGAYTLQSFYNGGILLSSDGGLHWQTLNEGLPSNAIMDLEDDQQYLYASVSGHGLWKRPLADLEQAIKPQPSPPPLRISVGPNPCEGTLRILAMERTENGQLDWFDMQGRLLLIQPVGFICDEAIIDLPLQDGFYTYRLKTPSGQAVGKLLLKR